MFRTLVSLGTIIVLLAHAASADGADRDDCRIELDVKEAINRYPHFTIFDDVNITVRDAVATLTGRVTMAYKRDEIEKRVEGVGGARDVRNRIMVLPASTVDDELRQRIARAIYGNASFWEYAAMPRPPIHILVERSHVTLTGVVRTDGDLALARALATQFGALSVTVRLKTDVELGKARVGRQAAVCARV